MLEALRIEPEVAEYPSVLALQREGLRALPRRGGTGPGAQDETGGEALDLIFIDGLTGETIIGIHESELLRPQPLVIDVCAGVPHTLASSTDRIGDTIDYGDLRRRLLRLLVEHRVKLVEAFAELVADIVLFEFNAQWVRVRVAKPRKYPDVQALGVVIERRRFGAPLPLKIS